VLHQIIEHLLEVPFANYLSFFLVLGSYCIKVIDPHSLHLMEGWVMSSVNGVLTVDITNAKEGIVGTETCRARNQRDLMY
jgi:hypothetical protein